MFQAVFCWGFSAQMGYWSSFLKPYKSHRLRENKTELIIIIGWSASLTTYSVFAKLTLLTLHYLRFEFCF